MMESLPDASQKFVQYLLDYIFPPCCAACQRRGTILCPSCIAQVRPVPAPYSHPSAKAPVFQPGDEAP
ncbi:MAG TPA: double zinc ribbon domain-containing protein, partial [Ktedonobacteraceae bacterium]|nr:double zinc ribbon domain-containing protein [Ktedonobacteraceae bacterium]